MNLALARAHGRLTQIRLLTADIYFFEKSDDCFPCGQLPETFLGPRKTTQCFLKECIRRAEYALLHKSGHSVYAKCEIAKI